jgi:hypothetical protein
MTAWLAPPLLPALVFMAVLALVPRRWWFVQLPAVTGWAAVWTDNQLTGRGVRSRSRCNARRTGRYWPIGQPRHGKPLSDKESAMSTANRDRPRHDAGCRFDHPNPGHR